MTLTRTCCCNGECNSIYRVFKPCQDSPQGMEYRAVAVTTQELEDSDLEVGKIYLFDAPNCPDEYCGEWVCIDGADDNLCRDTPADPDDCGDCAEYDGSLEEPYELEPNPSQAFWNLFTETESNDCCDIICPTICDDFGTPVQCFDPFDPDGCPVDACYDASLLQYQVSVGASTSNASKLKTFSAPGCPDVTVTTSATTQIVGSWSGLAKSRAQCPNDDVLLIGLIYLIEYTTTPWDCDKYLDLNPCSGGWCTQAEGNPPPNTQYDYKTFILEVGPCGLTTGVSSDLNNQYLNAAIPGYVAAYNALQSWNDITNGCGIQLNPGIPTAGSGSGTLFNVGIGWGGDAVCLDLSSQQPFNAMDECVTSGSTVGGSVVQGEIDWSVRLRLTLPNRPNPCV